MIKRMVITLANAALLSGRILEKAWRLYFQDESQLVCY